MKREEISDLIVLLAVVDAGNFTRAAVRLGITQSAVSHVIRRLEAAIGVRLLNRTARHVTTTDAGEKLLDALRPGLGHIDARIEELRLLGDVPRGLVRLTASRPAARAVLWPVLSQTVRDYPDVQIELSLETRLTDIAEDRFDAGIRLGEFVGPDMISVRVGPLVRMAAVAAPAYFERRKPPHHPSELDEHACLALRFNPHASPYDWEFEQDNTIIVKKVSGPFIFNESEICIDAAKQGHGIAFVTETEVAKDIEDGSLRRVLADWCPPFEGYHLFYSSRRQVSSALRLIIDRLKNGVRI